MKLTLISTFSSHLPCGTRLNSCTLGQITDKFAVLCGSYFLKTSVQPNQPHPTCFFLEISFVPSSGNQDLKSIGESDEDSGMIVTTVTDVREDQRDFLLFADARNMTEVARANFDVDIPMSSHSIVV